MKITEFEIGEKPVITDMDYNTRISGKIEKIEKNRLFVTFDDGEVCCFYEMENESYLCSGYDTCLFKTEKDLLEQIEKEELEMWIDENVCRRISEIGYTSFSLKQLRNLKQAVEKILEE